MKIEVQYKLDKVTAGAYRFRPLPEHEEIIGENAFLYLRKDICQKHQVDPNAGFTMTLER